MPSNTKLSPIERRMPPVVKACLSIFVVLFLSLLPVHAVSPEQNEGTQSDTMSGIKTMPAEGAELTAPARSLRVWLPFPPDVAQSSLKLVGPRGELTVQGLHTMGEDDLMARVVGAMPNGEYTATWSTTHDGKKLEGSWKFTVKRRTANDGTTLNK